MNDPHEHAVAIVGVGAAIEYIASWGEGPDLRSKLVSAVGAIADWEHELAHRSAASPPAPRSVSIAPVLATLPTSMPSW